MKVLQILIVALLASGLIFFPCHAQPGGCGPKPCLPDRLLPPETIGPMSLPFDVPIYPTLIKTEFHILPWISFGKASICLPYSCTAIELPLPCLSLKPIPVWFPWLRPIDVDCVDGAACKSP